MANNRSSDDWLAIREDRQWRQIADDVVLMSFPFRILGIDFRRNVTLLRMGGW